MAPASDPTIDYAVILPDVNGRQVLLLPAAEGWSLPHWTATGPPFWQVVDHVNDHLRERFGVVTTVLRCLENGRDPETGRRRRVYALENHSPSWTPPAGARWAGEESLSLARPQDRSLLQPWFDEVPEGRVPEKRAPWACAGWFDGAAAWMRDELRRVGLATSGSIEQLRTWQRSCLLRIPTTEGAVYFKAVPAMFALEPRLTRYLANLYPTRLPRVLAVEPDRRWLLMRDFGGRSLEEFPDLERWEAAVRAYARIQIDCATRIDQLMALGCPDRRLDRLEVVIDALVEDTELLLPESEEGLSPSQISKLRRLAPRLKAMCRELGCYPVPPSLEHGDFYYAQIIVTGESSLFIDWSDSSVAHPFFSMYLFFAYGQEEERFPTIPDAWTRLRDAYLEPWTIFEPMERLLAAFELSQALAAVHGAVFYQQFVLPHLETRQEWEAMAPWLLKRLLREVNIR